MITLSLLLICSLVTLGMTSVVVFIKYGKVYMKEGWDEVYPYTIRIWLGLVLLVMLYHWSVQ